jgi:transposase InsO family protein
MRFVGEHRDRFGVEPILQVCGIPFSTFYDWQAKQRDPCQRRRHDSWLLGRIPTGEGPLWLASVRGAFSRRIVGWKTSDRADTGLVLGALEYAVWGRGLDTDPGQPRRVHHSGSEYVGAGCSWAS